MASIRLDNVSKVFPGGQVAVESLDLLVADGEFLVLVGPSGCGKSTTLRMVAGLETPSRGRIFLDDREVTSQPPQARDLAMVFQSYALYPHKTVRQNLEFGLKMRRVSRDVIARRVGNVAQVLGLEELLDRKPAQLSGGQRQRVALGRAIVREPQAFLLDEPLSNLDAKLRVHMRAELARLHRRLQATMLYVTHDQEEAMTLGDRVAVLHAGRLVQCAAPLELYRRPANCFVAGFIGSPAMNFFRCRPTGPGQVQGPGFTLQAPESISALVPRASGARPDLPDEVILGVRPQDIRLVALAEGDVQARVEVVQPLGSEMLVHVATVEGGDNLVSVMAPASTGVRAGEEVGLRFQRDQLHLFDAHSEQRIADCGS
jgi:multiple sugar transport system ATP-binding protein